MTKKIDPNIQEFLVDFGLTEREITLYLTLLKTGPNTIMNLARETGIKRSTTHNNVEELVKKGLVSQTNFGERRMVVAEDPDKLKFLMEQKKFAVDRMEKNLPNVVTAITKLVPDSKEKNKVDVRYYEGVKNVESIYADMSKVDEAFSFANVDKYYEVFNYNSNLLWDALDKNPKRKVWDILVDTPFARENSTGHKRYFCKFIPNMDAFGGFDILTYDNKVAIIQLDPDNVKAILIDSPMIANSIKALHQTMWNLLNV